MTTDGLTDLALAPGSGCDWRVFAPQIEALRCAVRTHVVGNTEQSRIDRLARIALGRLPDRFALAGLSQGGLVALEIVRQAPERVTGLALLDTLPGPGLRTDRVLHRVAIAMLAARAFGPIDRIMWPRYVAPARLDDADLVTVSGSGHLTTLEAPDAVSAALQNWLCRIRRHADPPTPASDPSTPRTAT